MTPNGGNSAIKVSRMTPNGGNSYKEQSKLACFAEP